LRDAAPDPIQELVHDHRELNGLLLAVHEALARVARAESSLADELHEIRDGIEAFCDELLVHFAREQEALLPFVVIRLPAMSPRADAIIVEHDVIAASLTTLVQTVSSVEDATLGPWRATLARFEELYAAHTRSELSFLEDVVRHLQNDPASFAQLRDLLDRT
jgi:hemerythrin-like domain-containing protein